MKTIKIPYYKHKESVHIEEHNLKQIIEPISFPYNEANEIKVVADALSSPIGTLRLCEIARNKESALVITSDHTRPMPSKVTLPLLLEEIRKYNPDIKLKILIATGLHRSPIKEEMVNMFGSDIVENENICVHDAFKKEDMYKVGILPSGIELFVNKLVYENELVVTEGFIEPHFFAGFSGGRKSILPGVAYAETINQNHSATAVGDKNSRAGVLKGNVIHGDMSRAAKLVNVDFCLNVIMDRNKRIIAAFAGDISGAHLRGCDMLTRHVSMQKCVSDIVISSNGGYPLDQNLYQCAKGISNADKCSAKDGVIIFAASCCDGMGGDKFDMLMRLGSPEQIYKTIIAISPKETIPEQWCAQILTQILMKKRIIFVTRHFDHDTIRQLNMIPAETVDGALAMAYEMKGTDASVTIIPDGVSVIIKD